MNTSRLLLYLIIPLVLIGCKKDPSKHFFTVESVIDGGTLKLKNGSFVRLIGISGGENSQKYLINQVEGKEIRLVFDKQNKTNTPTNKNEYWAYTISKDGISINTEILQKGLAELDLKFLGDSLTQFRSYANNPSPVQNSAPDKSTPTANYTPAEIYKKYESAILVVYSGNSTEMSKFGTGFLIRENIAVTNHHVIEGGSQISVKTKTEEMFKVIRIIAQSAEYDFAVLEIERNVSNIVIPVNTTTPTIGEDIVLIGNPRGLEFTLTKGVVSAIREKNSIPGAVIQFDAAMSKGNSGSPVINMRGEVVGIATFYMQDCENCNFGYASKLFLNAIKE